MELYPNYNFAAWCFIKINMQFKNCYLFGSAKQRTAVVADKSHQVSQVLALPDPVNSVAIFRR